MSASTQWTKDMVVQMVRHFASAPLDSNQALVREWVRDFVRFEQVVNRHLVELKAEQLARDFIHYGQGLIQQRKLHGVYLQLKNAEAA